MKKFFLFASLILALFNTGCNKSSSDDSVTATPMPRGLLIPVYFNDENGSWDKVIYNDVEEVAVMNPDNGPGSYAEERYLDFISSLVSNSKKPIGYVNTDYTSRYISDVEADIDKWIELYPDIEGFFLDEVSEKIENIEYYKTLYDYIKSKGDYFVVLNVGAIPDKSYFDIADNIVVFENDAGHFLDGVCNIYPEKASVIVYGASEAQMRDIIQNNKCRYFYITDDSGIYPYDRLPTYFDEESSLLK